MQFRLALFVVTSTALLMSCFSPESVTCGDKATVCPSGWVCIEEQSACINPLETSCGNGVSEAELGEECDDGNFDNNDECNWNCKFPGCGDGFKRGEEVCDDGNTNNGDGCSADCRSQETCGDGIPNEYIHIDAAGNTLPAEECDTRGESTTCNADCTKAKCGDAKTNTTAGEECDDGILGTAVDSDDCTKTCKASKCGDGYPNLAAGEACDKGLFCVDGKVCTTGADCVGIGDGSCAPRDRECCTASCQNPSCGNGAVEVECEGTVNEVCDIGKFCANLTIRCSFDAECNGIGDGLCKTRNQTGCSADCLSPEQCGDGYTNAYLGEVCDNGKQCSDLTTACKDDADCAEIGDGTCATRDNDGCTADCKSTEQCGDGVTNDYGEYQEVCDNGSQCTNGQQCKTADDCIGIGNGSCAPRNQDGCSADCKSVERCGDSVTSSYPIPLKNLKPMAGHPNVGEEFDAPEVCDDGNTLDGDGCSADCLSDEKCGDNYDNDYPHLDELTGNMLPPELCDDGNNNNGDGCSANCRSLEQCGNGGEPDEGEECDDGNKVSGDGCSATCEIERCGDGEKDAGEGCDDGELNSDSGNCKLNCQPNICGDNQTNASLNGLGNPTEECDNGAINSEDCNFDCTVARCGDGKLNFASGEFCDEGPGSVLGESKETLRCNVDCSFAFCGDGLTNEVRGELCDDGNNNDGDGCSADCRSTELCGDGVINRAAPQLEVCDNGKSCEDGTECGSDADCAVGQCVTRDSDGCSEDCRSQEVCGDAYLNNYAPYLESCDDGNQVTGDGCNGTTCKTDSGWSCPNLGQPCVEICRDGLVVGDETCDEGTAIASGGCTACVTQRGWSCPKNVTTGAGGLCTPICGDGIVRGNETCDDGNTVATDGCDATCKKVDGWSCPIAGGNGGVCTAICNDSKVVGPETCDDGGTISGDGCDSGCRLEVPGWQCPISGGVGGTCTPICGDALVRGTESCDEGSAPPSGGCTLCAKASGWDCDQPGTSCKEICGDPFRVGIETTAGHCDNGTQNGNNKVCTANCKVADCTDGLFLTDGAAAETDVDCGGANACARCSNDSRCVVDSDCVSNFCTTGLRCQTPTLSPDTWTFAVNKLDGNRQKTVPIANLLSNDATAAGGLASDAVFTLVAQPTCGTVAVDGANVVFTDEVTSCAWGRTFTYKVCTPANPSECSSPTTVTVNVNHPPSLSFPSICLPLTTPSASVNVASTAIFIDPDSNPWGSFSTPPSFVSGPGGHTAALNVTGSSIALVPTTAPQPGEYKVSVAACDNVAGENVSDDTSLHKGCSAATDWKVKWQASVDLRETLEANPFPVALSAALSFPLGGVATNTIVEGAAPASAVVKVSRFANGPFTTSAPTSVTGSVCAYVDDANLLDGDDRRVTYTAATTAGADNCYVQVCEACGDLQLCSIVRVPVTVVNNPVATADAINGLQGKTPARSTAPVSVATLTANDQFIHPASFVLVNWATQTVAGSASTECGGTVTVTDNEVIYTGPLTPTVPCETTDRYNYRVTSPLLPATYAYGTVTITINHHPVLGADAITTTEDTPIVIVYRGTGPNDVLEDNDSDFEDLSAPLYDTLTVTAVGDAIHGNVYLSGQTITFVPTPPDYNGVASFKYTVSDGNGGYESATVTVNITPVVDLANDTLLGTEDTDLVFNPIKGTAGASADSFESPNAHITQINGNSISIGDSATVTNGSISLAADNVLTFVPADDFNGVVPVITYTVLTATDDGGPGLTETGNINITVNVAGDIMADKLSTTEDTPVPFDPVIGSNGAEADLFVGAAQITHIAGQAIAPGGPSINVPNGTVALLNGLGSPDNELTFTPNADFNGIVNFTYTVLAGGPSETANIEITVDPVPDITADTVSTNEDIPKVFDPVAGTGGATADLFESVAAQISAINGIPIVANGSVAVTGGSVKLAATGNELTFTPTGDFNGVSVFSYSVLSGTVTETANITMTVNAVTDIHADALTTTEDVVGGLVFNPVTGAGGATLDTFVAGASITHINGLPIANNGSVNVTNGSVALAATNVLTFAPAADFYGIASFSYTVLSGGVSETANIAITVTAVADIVADEVTTTEDVTNFQIHPVVNDTFSATGIVAPQIMQINGVTITAGGAPVSVLNGTVALATSPANRLLFTPTADYYGDVIFSYTVRSGTAALTETANILVHVTPSVDIHADAVTLDEDTTVTFNPLTATGNGLGGRNGTADTFAVGATITAINATPIVAGGGEVLVPNGKFTLAAGNNLTFTPAQNFSGTTGVTYTVTSGGVTETAAIVFTVNPLPDGPEITTPAGTRAYTENAAAVTLEPNLSATDVDDVNMASGSVKITAGFTTGDTFAYSPQGGITVTNGGNGELLLSGIAPLTNYVALLKSVTFASTSDHPTSASASRSIEWKLTDANGTGAGAASGTANTTITITAVNDGPTATITPSSYAVTEQTNFNLHNNGLAVTDVDAGSGTVTVHLITTVGIVTVVPGTSNVNVANSASADVTLTGTVAQINALFSSTGGGAGTVIYNANVDNPAATATLTLTIDDGGNTGGGALTAQDTATLNIDRVNDAPTATIVQTSFAVTEQVAFSLHGANTMSVADVDAGSGDLVVTLSTNEGIFDVTPGNSGVDVGAGTNLTSSVTLTGTLLELNSLFAGTSTGTVIYNANVDGPSASATLTLQVSDGGNTGSGGPKTGQDTATLNITAVNDAPTFTGTVPSPLVALEDTATDYDLSALDFTDLDIGAGTATITLTPSVGTITATGIPGVTVGGVAPAVTFTGTLAALEAYLDTVSRVKYQGPLNANGLAAATITVKINDNGNSPAPGVDVPVATTTVDITAVNDAPTFTGTVPATLAATEDTAIDYNLDPLDFDDVDIAAGAATVTLTTTGGTITATTGGGVTVAGTATARTFTGTLTSLETFFGTASNVTYTGAANVNGNNADTIVVKINDNGNTPSPGVDVAVGTTTVNIAAANDAPVLDSSKSPTFSTTSEGNAVPSLGSDGTPVSQLVDFATPSGQVDNVTDLDTGAQLGIAITAVNDNGKGTWYFYNGTAWASIAPAPTEATALLLRPTDRLYFKANAATEGHTASITFRAWDQTSGTFGTPANTVPNGGTTAFSIVSDTVSLTIAGVNEAPVLNAAASPALLDVAEDAGAPSGAVGSRVDQIVDFVTGGSSLDNVTDGDPGAVLGIALISTAGAGTWHYSLDNGANWTPVGTVSSGQALLLTGLNRIYYQPPADYNGTLDPAITFRAWDTTAGTAGTKVTPGLGGGVTPVSTASDTASITVTPIDDPPVGSPSSITLSQDSFHDFLTSEFPFSDPDGDTLFQVQIVALPALGVLDVNGSEVEANDVLSLGDIALLTYTPPPGATGIPYTTFTFRVGDSSILYDSTPRVMTINVTSGG